MHPNSVIVDDILEVSSDEFTEKFEAPIEARTFSRAKELIKAQADAGNASSEVVVPDNGAAEEKKKKKNRRKKRTRKQK